METNWCCAVFPAQGCCAGRSKAESIDKAGLTAEDIDLSGVIERVWMRGSQSRRDEHGHASADRDIPGAAE
jgi:hypothetical protein